MGDTQSDDVLNQFNRNKNPQKAMHSLVYSDETNDRVSGYSQKIGTLVTRMMNNLESQEGLENLAKDGDLAALACLGAWHLIHHNETLAYRYFHAVANSPLNRSGGELEHAIGTWLKDPREKARYFRFAISKGRINSAFDLINCIPGKILNSVRYQGYNKYNKYGVLGPVHYTVGALYAMLELKLQNKNLPGIPRDEDGKLFYQFAQYHPKEFRELFIQYSKEQMAVALGSEANASSKFFMEYQAELVDNIIKDMIKNNMTIEQAAKSYENDYHTEYFTNLPALVNEKQIEIERKASEALEALEKTMNQKIRESLTEMIKIREKESKARCAADRGHLLTDTENVYLLTKNSFQKNNGDSLTEIEKKYLNEIVGANKSQVTVSDYEAFSRHGTRTIKRNSIILLLSAEAMVADILSSRIDLEMKDSGSTFPAAKKLMCALNTITKATEQLSKINTDASNKAALSWNEIAIYCVVSIIYGVAIIPAMIAGYILDGSASYKHSKIDAGKAKLASKKAMGLFKEAARETMEAAHHHLPTAHRNKKSNSK